MNILTATQEQRKNYFKEHAPDKCFDCLHCQFSFAGSIVCMESVKSHDDFPRIVEGKKITSCNKKEKM